MAISLVEKRREIDHEVIDILEDALALAREGKIRDLVIGYTDDEQGFFTRCTYERFIAALGLAEMLKIDVANTADQGTEG
jgi:hypothetical protein